MGLQPEVTLATYVASNVGSLTLGTNCFHGPVTPDPDKGVWIFPTGGTPVTRFLGETEHEKHVMLQVRTRWTKQDFANGLVLARSVSDTIIGAIHNATFAAYLDLFVLQSDPLYLGEDDQGLPEWSQNVEAHFKE